MIIGVSGQAGSGKDTASDFLVENHGFVKIALADEMKRICMRTFNFTEEQLWGPSSKRNEEDARYPRESGGCLTPRLALQLLGSEWGRVCYPDIWVDIALRNAAYLFGTPYAHYERSVGVVPPSDLVSEKGHHYEAALHAHRKQHAYTRGVVISDVRWPEGNEGQRIRAAGGILLRMKRGVGLQGEAGQHSSELEQQKTPDSYFDAVADNNEWSLEQLEAFMATLVITSKRRLSERP